MRRQICFCIKKGGEITPIFHANVDLDTQLKWLRKLRSQGQPGYGPGDKIHVWDSDGSMRVVTPWDPHRAAAEAALPAPLPPTPPTLPERVEVLEQDVSQLKNSKAKAKRGLFSESS